MKKILFIIAILFLVVGCCEGGNQGYGYNTSTSTEQPQRSSYSQRIKAHTMDLRDANGRMCTTCTAYKGEFDGHTWYVFYDNLAAPAVVHDPLCKCYKGE